MALQPNSPLKLPLQSEVELKLLFLLANRTKATETQSAYRELAQTFKLTQAQRHGSAKGAEGSAWEYLVRQAARHLKDEGLLESAGHGLWRLTAAGQKRATATPDSLGL